MNRVAVVMLLVMLLAGCGRTILQKHDKGLALRKSDPMQIYMGACVISRAAPELVKRQAQELGFVSVSGEDAQRYLNGNEGIAWVKRSGDAHYGLTLLQNSLCSLFIHQGNPGALRASMEAWMPPENSGFSYEKKIISENGYLVTTQYRIFRSGVLEEQWIITTNSQPGSDLVAIMSYDGP